MADYTLPNGRVITGLSEDYTPDEIKNIAINGGYATEADYARNVRTGADYLTTAGEMGGGVAGAMAGASIGTAIAPGPGTFIGGLIGGAVGTFAGSAAGQVAEAAVENRDFSSDVVIKEAGKAAAIDTAFGLGFGAAGKAIKAIAQPLTRLAKPAVSATEDLNKLVELQGKLSAFDTTLLPSQIGDTSLVGRGAETYAASSLAFRPEYDRIVRGYDTYVSSTADELLKRLEGKPREEVGKAFVKLADDVQKAVDEVVDPLYKDIDQRGGLMLNSSEIKDRLAGYLEAQGGGIGRTSSAARKIMSMVDGLPPTMSPAQLASEMPQILETARRLSSNDAQATALHNIMNGYVKKINSSPSLIDTGSVITGAKGELTQRVAEDGTSRVGGEYKQALDYVSRMRRKMSFAETRQELSYMKKKLREMESPVNPNDAAASVYSKAVSGLESAMEESAKKFDKELYATYRQTSDFYKKSQETIFSPYIKQALQSNEPAKVGEILARTGYVTPTRELDSLVKFADELGVKEGKSVRSQITKSYLENLFPKTDAAALTKFNKDMLNPKFRDTFMAVVPKDIAEPLTKLAEEAEILARHMSGGSGASLSIASREIGAVENPLKLRSMVVALLPNAVSRYQISGKAIASKLNAMKVINAQIAAGKEPSQSALAHIFQGLPNTAMQAGIATGAAVRQ